MNLGPTVNDAGDERRDGFGHSGTVVAGTFSAGCGRDRREEHVELVKRKEKSKLELWRYRLGTPAWGGVCNRCSGSSEAEEKSCV